MTFPFCQSTRSVDLGLQQLGAGLLSPHPLCLAWKMIGAQSSRCLCRDGNKPSEGLHVLLGVQVLLSSDNH